MQVAGQEIFTPHDTPYAYETEWRHKAACAMNKATSALPGSTCMSGAGRDIFTPLLRDDLVFAQTQYLYNSTTDPVFDLCASEGIFAQLHHANRVWQTTGRDFTMERISALLLCPEFSYRQIASRFDLDEKDVICFEKLFFNVRDEEGKLKGNTGVLQHAALKGAQQLEPAANRASTNSAYWRVLAFEGGYKSLFAAWGWPYEEDFPGFTVPEFTVNLMRSTYRYLDKELRFGERMDLRAVGQILTTLSGQLADMRKEGILSEKDKVDPDHLILAVLSLVAPVRITDGTDKVAANRELQARLKAIREKEGRVGPEDKPAVFRSIDAQLSKGALNV
jgi:hypothetical protein